MRINSKKIISINGFNCKYHIWGQDETNPIIIFVHGGPGLPIRHKIKKNFKDLTDKYTLVCYDQRGTAGSYSSSMKQEDLTLDKLISDLVRLAEYFLKTSATDKIYLIGESFGSLISVGALTKAPQLFSGYIGVGQYTDTIEMLKEQYRLLKEECEKNRDGYVLDFLNALPELTNKITWNEEQCNKFISYLYKILDYGRQDQWKKAVVKPLRKTWEFTRKEKRQIKFGRDLYHKVMGYECYSVRNFGLKFECPFYVLSGEKDFTTPISLSKSYVKNEINAPDHKFVTFENCGHSCMFEQPQRFMVLVRKFFSNYRQNMFEKD